jgi:hypothetical protein
MIANCRRRLVAAPLLLAWGWLCNPLAALPDPPTEPGTFRITRSQLFVGDLARLEPHLDLTGSGCVKLDYQGTRKLLVSLEVWENGKAKALSPIPFSYEPARAGDLSMSVRETTHDGKPKYKIIVSSGGATFSMYVDIPSIKDSLTSVKRLSDSISAKEGRAVPIWALNKGKGSGEFHHDESVEEMAKRVEWSLVVKVAIEKAMLGQE